MSKQEVQHPDKTASTGAYAAGVVCDGWLHVSGQGPIDMATGQVMEGTIEAQTRLTLSHVEKILRAAGCTFDDVVKCVCHLSDIGDFSRFNEVYAEHFTGVRPARTTVQSVLWGGIKVEIDAVARIPKRVNIKTKEIIAEDRKELERLINEYGIIAVSEFIVEATGKSHGLEKQDAEGQKTDDVHCSFCGKRRDQVDSLIAGPNVCICVECVGLCNEMIERTQKPTSTG